MINILDKKSKTKIYKHKKAFLTDVLLLRVKFFIDLVDVYNSIIIQSNSFKRIINKYAKENKNQNDIRKFKDRQEELIDKSYFIRKLFYNDLKFTIKELIENNYELFKNELSSVEPYSVFEEDDYIFVKEVAIKLSYCSFENISEEIIFNIINESIDDYLDCIEKNINYNDFLVRVEMTKNYKEGDYNV